MDEKDIVQCGSNESSCLRTTCTTRRQDRRLREGSDIASSPVKRTFACKACSQRNMLFSKALLHICVIQD